MLLSLIHNIKSKYFDVLGKGRKYDFDTIFVLKNMAESPNPLMLNWQ